MTIKRKSHLRCKTDFSQFLDLNRIGRVGMDSVYVQLANKIKGGHHCEWKS